MIKKSLKYPITYLLFMVVIYSVYDYFEHVSRSGSTFEEHPWYWLLFNVSAIFSFVIIVLFVKKSFQKIFKQKSLVIEVTAVGVWLLLYISSLGPFIDKVFWPFDNLHFMFSFGPVFIVLMAYFIIRILINLIVGKNALYSK